MRNPLPRPVLVGVDCSTAAHAAVAAGTEEARLRSAPLRLLTVTDWPVGDTSVSDHDPDVIWLVRGCAKIPMRDRVAEVAELLVGHRRRRRRGTARLGSTTHAVVQRAGCPLAVVAVGGAR